MKTKRIKPFDIVEPIDDYRMGETGEDSPRVGNFSEEATDVETDIDAAESILYEE